MRFKMFFAFLVVSFPLIAQESNTIFHLNLEKTISLALENSYELRHNRIAQIVSEKYVSENYRLFLPILGIDFAQSGNVVPYGPDSRMETSKLRVEQPLFRGGRHWAALQSAKNEITLRRLEYTLTRLSLLSSVRKKYYEYLTLAEILRINELLEQDAMAQVEIARIEHSIGVLTVIDLAEIEAYAANSKLDKVRSKHELELCEKQLKKMAYLDPHQPISIDQGILDKVQCLQPGLSDSEAIQLAFQARPDMLAKRIEWQRASREYRTGKFHFLPELTLDFEYDFRKNSGVSFERSWNAGISCSFQLGGIGISGKGNTGLDITSDGRSKSVSGSASPFSDISLYRTLIENEGKYLAAKAAYEQTEKDLSMEISSGLLALNENWEMMGILKERESILLRRFEIYQLKLKVGEAKRADSLKAEVEYAKARTETMKGIMAYINAAMDLESALGQEPGSMGFIINKEKN